MRSGVTVGAIPEHGEHHPKGHPMVGSMLGTTTFWVCTHGMERVFGLPELEMKDVPALFVMEALRLLNHWGSYMADSERPVLVGERLSWGGEIEVALLVCDATHLDPVCWEGRRGYRLVPDAVRFECSHPTHDPRRH